MSVVRARLPSRVEALAFVCYPPRVHFVFVIIIYLRVERRSMTIFLLLLSRGRRCQCVASDEIFHSIQQLKNKAGMALACVGTMSTLARRCTPERSLMQGGFVFTEHPATYTQSQKCLLYTFCNLPPLDERQVRAMLREGGFSNSFVGISSRNRNVAIGLDDIQK